MYKSKKKRDLFDYFLFVACLFPIITTLIDGTPLNRILFVLLIGLYILILIQQGASKRTLCYLAVLLINFILAIFITGTDIDGSANMFVYYPFMVGYTCLIMDKQERFVESLIKNKKYVLFILKLWSVIVGISAFLPIGYYIKEGGAYYFGSFAGSIFRLGPAALFISGLVLVSMRIYGRRKDFFYLIIPMYCVFMGSSRTYLVVELCLFVIAWYWFVGKRKTFWLTIIPLGVIALVLIWNSSMGEKVRYTLDDSNYGDFWFRISSGRSDFWMDDINGWLSQDWFHKIFGCGIFFTVQLTGIWAHNDFIELLCSFGILGLVEYSVLQLHLIGHFLGSKRKIPLVISLCVIVCWLFNAIFNMYYTYFCALLSYPLVLIVVSYTPKKERQANEPKRKGRKISFGIKAFGGLPGLK